MTTTRRLVILGATGTVGLQTLKIIDQANSAMEVVCMSAHSSTEALQALGEGHAGVQLFSTSNDDQRAELLTLLRTGHYDICMNAVVGAAGLPYSEAVLAAGCDLALANKESLVLAGELLTDLARVTGAAILPVDSEHSAIHQCLQNAAPASIRRLYLTASGGALRDLPLDEFADVTPERALAHPNWAMGPRITVDSATMMNKCLEIIEACHLFDVPASKIEVLIHRQSVVHSMVEFLDGSLLAQLGPPDMRFPIHYALHYPERAPSPLQGFDAKLFSNLTFDEAETARYPALKLGWQAAKMGGAAGAVLNAADEIAVQAFLAGQLAFPEITEVCSTVLTDMPELPSATLDQILAADAWARHQASAMLQPSRT